MDQQRWQQIEALFQRACEIAPDERASLLAHACDGDVELRREVEALLKDESRINSFLKEPAIARVASEFAAAESLCGQRIGHYEMRALLGQGGMGAVWKAWDDKLKREVAIKILPQEFAADPERIARFQQEARAASVLKHPNIITIHEIGQVTMPHGELYFIVTEFIEGQTLREYLAQPDRSWRDAVRLATQIASALTAAHAADLIHRDIKPENIMVQPDGQVKVLDFGIAKLAGSQKSERGTRKEEAEILSLTAQSDSPSPQEIPRSALSVPTLTVPGTRLGTIRYMSPEQARGEALDARTDIFSLGVVLYELLVGQRPYGNVPDDEMMQQLMEAREIAPVSQLLPNIPAALDRIVTRALRKNREERYATANEMLSDLQQLRINREEKGLQRLRTQSANQMLTQFAVRYDEDKTTRIPLGGLWTIGRFADLPRGKLERELMRKSRWNVLWRLGGLALGIAAVTMLIAAWASITETWEEKVLRDGHTAAVRRAVFSPDGKRLVSVGEDKQVIVWDFEKRERLATFNDHTDWVAAVAFSPDGKWFATASYDKTVIVWDAIKLQKETVLRGHRGKVVSVAFSPDGQVLVSANNAPQPEDRATLLWRVGSWEKFAQLPLGYSEPRSLLFTANGRRLIYHLDTSDDHLPNTWDVVTGQPLDNEFDPAWTSNNAALSLNDTVLVSVTTTGEVIFANFKRRQLLDRFKAHQDNGRAVAISPDGRFVATGSENIILWDVATRQKITTIDYPSIVWSAAFSPDGKWLVSTHGDGGIRVWDVMERQRAIGFNEHNGPVRAVAWASDGKRFASAGEDRSVMIWNATSGRREMLLSGHPTRVTGVAFAPDGNTLASVDRDGTVIVWELAQRQERLRFGHPVAKDGNCLAISPDGRVIATSHGVYDSTTGQQVADFSAKGNDWLNSSAIYSLAFSADGTRLVTANASGRSFVCDTATWSLIEKADFSPRQFISISSAPNGKQLVTGEDGGLVQLWTVQPLRPTKVLGQHDARIKSVAFSPDGTQVVSAGDDKTIALWDVGSRRLVTRIGLHTSPVYAVAFSPDGQQLVSGEHDHSVRFYTRRRSLWGWSLD